MPNDYSAVKLTEYADFVTAVEDLGFMPLSNNSIGFVSLSGITSPEQWHTDLPSDPWLWKTRIEAEHKAAYGKLFDKKPGFISLEWYPFFYAARRKGCTFNAIYADGLLNNHAKQIYSVFDRYEDLAMHEIKAIIGYGKENASKYETALTELQMWMFITGNGLKNKISKTGEPYGWPVITYATTERWAGEELIRRAGNIKSQDAVDEILLQIEEVCPEADSRKIKKFVGI